jgi:hypothetical protein
MGDYDTLFEGMVSGDVPFGMPKGIEIPDLDAARERLVSVLEAEATQRGFTRTAREETRRADGVLDVSLDWENEQGSTGTFGLSVSDRLLPSFDYAVGISVDTGDSCSLFEVCVQEGPVASMNDFRETLDYLKDW